MPGFFASFHDKHLNSLCIRNGLIIIIMRTLQKYLPSPKHYEIMRIFVSAKPAVAWERARHYKMSSIPWVNFLFKLRTGSIGEDATFLFVTARMRLSDRLLSHCSWHHGGSAVKENSPICGTRFK